MNTRGQLSFPVQKAREGDVDGIRAWCQSSNTIDGLIRFDEWRPLQFAAAEGNDIALGTLLEAGADPKAISESRVRPCHGSLHIAVRYGHASVAARLIAAGADPNQFDSYGLTPLHYAAVQNHVSTAERLLELGADPNTIINKTRPSATALARHCGHTRMVELLEAARQSNTTENHNRLKTWLTDIGCQQYLTQIIDAGYDFDLIADHGLAPDDVQAIGIPAHKKGHEKKLLMRHKFPFYLRSQSDTPLHDQKAEDDLYVHSNHEDEDSTEERDNSDDDDEEENDEADSEDDESSTTS